VLVTTHQAYFTKEAMVEITTTTLENIEAFEKGLTLNLDYAIGVTKMPKIFES
jgi:lactate dehydrogenase-like 2-hydroxyacid dehydrogenase